MNVGLAALGAYYARCRRFVGILLYLLYHRGKLLVVEAHLTQYFYRLLCRETLEVGLSRRYYHSSHVESSRTDHQRTLGLRSRQVGIACRTVAAAREYHREIFVAVSPAHDVHHRLIVVLCHWQRLVNEFEQFGVALQTLAADEQCRRRIFVYHGNALAVVVGGYLRHVAAIALPSRLQRQQSARAGLEMTMVGSRRSAFRTVVEHHQLGEQREQTVYLAVVVVYCLWLVGELGYREMCRQDRVGVDEKFEVLVDSLRHLFLRTVLAAEEARTLLQTLLVYPCPCGDDACRIELHDDVVAFAVELALLHIVKVAEVLPCQVPLLHLSVEEAVERTVVAEVHHSLLYLLSGRELYCPDSVFIQVVGIHLLYAQSGIAVSAPSAAEIQFGENPANPVAAAEGERHGIVFAIACVWELQLPEQRCEESAWRSQSVDAQGIVASVVVGPFRMVYQSWRQRVEVEVTHAVASDDHCCMLLVEFVYDSLQRVFRRIEVVAVELHGEFSASAVVHRHIPASTDAEVGTLWHDVYELRL